MNFAIIILLLQTLLLPPRISMENPAAAAAVPEKARKDYDKAWRKFLAAKEDKELAKNLDKLVRKHKNFDAALTLQAYLELYQGSEMNAERKFEQILASAPNNRIALYYLAELAFGRKDYASASKLYGRLASIDNARSDVETKRQKALLLATDNLFRAAVQAETQNRFDEAEVLYRRILSMAPREPAFHARLAALLVRRKKWDEALTHYRVQAELGGATEETDTAIAEALVNLGRSDEARTILDRSRNRDGGDGILDVKLRELEDLGRWGSQIDYFHQIESTTSVTREQFSAMLVRYFPQITEIQQKQQIVTDIQASWARPEIQTILSIGLIDPFPNHTFRPSAPLTRGELAVSLSRLIRILGVSQTAAPPIPTSDVNPDDALHGDIQQVLVRGLMALDDSGNFYINGVVSGEETVRAVERLLTISHTRGA